MLCFGPLFKMQFADSLGISPLMTALRDKVDGFGNQRIGMTQQFYRAFPVTGDHQWVSERMTAIVDIADELIWPPEMISARDYSMNTDLFERTSYGPSVGDIDPVDTLAMCAMGLPAVGYDNGRGKQIVYIGDPQNRRKTPETTGLYRSGFIRRVFSRRPSRTQGFRSTRSCPATSTGPSASSRS